MNITSCRFERAALGAEDDPRASGPDVVFLGRSNVGKSSLINVLLGARGLARTSSSPGRTQAVHFYRINEEFWFVDLPGYGYARVPESVRLSWKPMVEGYLDRRQARIAVALLVIDARREPTETDSLMRDWLDSRGLPYVVAATKADKLSGNERAQATRRLERAYGSRAVGGPPILVSAESGRGIRELWGRIEPALFEWRGDRKHQAER